MTKLFDHANVGVVLECMGESCGTIKTTVFEDPKYDGSHMIPRVYKHVEFIYGGVIFDFKYKSQTDTETDEAVKYWTNVVKTTAGVGRIDES